VGRRGGGVSHDLAVALAERLTGVVPAGFVVHEQDAELVVLHDGQVVGISGAPTILETVDALREPRDNLETAARAALSAVQDYVAEVTTEPWPSAVGRQPNPDARIDGDSLSMWFGPEDGPVLRLRPVDLALLSR
jgi:hypothetical protein